MQNNKTILLVEDDADDRELLFESVKEVNPSVNIICAENGLHAVQYLSDVKVKQSQLPCLIVLDLNMPFLDGRATFEKIKHELRLEEVPVIIFTSSQNPNDKAHFNQLGAEFITKPDNYMYLKQIASHMLTLCCRA